MRPARSFPKKLAAPELRCVLRGDTVYDGKELDTNGCYYIPENIRTKPIKSVHGAEILVIAIPMYAQATWAQAQAQARAEIAA